MNTETGIGEMMPEAKEYLQLPKTGRDKNRYSSRSFRGSTAQSTPLFWTSFLQNCDKIYSVILSYPVCCTSLEQS